MIGSSRLIDHRFFPGDFWFNRFSYGIDNRSNSIDHFQKIGTTIWTWRYVKFWNDNQLSTTLRTEEIRIQCFLSLYCKIRQNKLKCFLLEGVTRFQQFLFTFLKFLISILIFENFFKNFLIFLNIFSKFL